MKHFSLKKAALALALSASMSATTSAASSDASNLTINTSSQSLTYDFVFRSGAIRGTNVTGTGEFCGQPLWSFTDQNVAPTPFTGLGAYRPGEEEPDALTPENCTTDVIITTRHDPVVSFDPPGDAAPLAPRPDTRLENIPIFDVPTNRGIFSGGAFGLRDFLDDRGMPGQNPFPAYRNRPAQDQYTLGQWTEASGTMSYACREDGTGVIWGSYRKLIPNGLYSMWGAWRAPVAPGVNTVAPAPLGGVPNVVTSNSRGSAYFKRELPFCPEGETENGSLLLWVSIVYHPDSSINGGVPELGGLVQTFFDPEINDFYRTTTSFMMNMPQLTFPINFTEALEFEEVRAP